MEFIQKIKNMDLPNSEIIEIKILEKGKAENGVPFDMPKRYYILYKTSFGEGSLIYSNLYLPESWNGRFIALGGGGMGGRLSTEYWEAIQKGYAVGQCDMGTSLLVKKLIIKGNSDLYKDSSWRSTHIMTVISKLIMKEVYGKEPEKSYFRGASAGGRQAMSEAQRFPEDYDGIFAGVPSMSGLYAVLYFLWMYQLFSDKDGNQVIPMDKVPEITKCAVEFFQAKGDGEKGDDFVSYPYAGESTISDFIAFLGKKMPELKEENLKLLETAYYGPVNKKNNKQIHSGLPIGSEYVCEFLMKPEKLKEFAWPWLRGYFGDDFDDRYFDFADQFEEIKDALASDFNALKPDLSQFYARGGKLIMYVGTADPLVPWPDALKYYNKVCEKMGGYEKVKDFFKFFILPGKAHGGGGKGVNTLWGDENQTDVFETLINWCEGAVAPEYVIGAHRIKDAIELADIEKKIKADKGSVYLVDALRYKVADKENYKFFRKIYPYKGDKVEGVDFPYACCDEYWDVEQNKE